MHFSLWGLYQCGRCKFMREMNFFQEGSLSDNWLPVYRSCILIPVYWLTCYLICLWQRSFVLGCFLIHVRLYLFLLPLTHLCSYIVIMDFRLSNSLRVDCVAGLVLTKTTCLFLALPLPTCLSFLLACPAFLYNFFSYFLPLCPVVCPHWQSFLPCCLTPHLT